MKESPNLKKVNDDPVLNTFTAKGADPFYTISELSEETGLSLGYISRILKKLINQGILEKDKYRDKLTGKYYILFSLKEGKKRTRKN